MASRSAAVRDGHVVEGHQRHVPGRQQRQLVRRGARRSSAAGRRAESLPRASRRSARLRGGNRRRGTSRRRPLRSPPTRCARDAVRRRTTAGVSATRRSNGPRSRSTPMFIPPPANRCRATGRECCAGVPTGRQDGAHERETEGVVLLAGVAQAGAVERQRVNGFQGASLKLLAVIAGDRRPAQHIAREQRGDAHGPSRGDHLERHIAGDQQVEEAGVVALLENQLVRTRSEPRPPSTPAAATCSGQKPLVNVLKRSHEHLVDVVFQ